MEITTGTTYAISFPHGMHKSDFTKCLSMARKLGSYDAPTKTWAVKVMGLHGQAIVREMADRGAQVTELFS